MNVQISRLLAGLLLVAACKGADGATGPQGPAGPQGNPGVAGPGTKMTYIVTIGSARTASVVLPAAAGSDPLKPPSLACYTAQNATNGVWLALSDGYSATSTYCGLVLSNGLWNASLAQGNAGWSAAFVVVY